MLTDRPARAGGGLSVYTKFCTPSPTVPTEQAAHYLNRRPQTLRGWACAETFPDGLRPVRINGRLGWPVAGIRAALGMEGA